MQANPQQALSMSADDVDDLPPLVDRRPQSRRRGLLGGLVTYSDGVECFDCRIRDLTDGGARITFPANRPVPTNVYLINIRDSIAYEAIIVWRKAGEGGLKFVRTLKLAELTDNNLRFLKTLWSSRALR